MRPSSTLFIRSDPAGSALCVLTMLLVGPVTLSSVAFTWVVFLLYSEVSLHHGTQSFRQRIYPLLHSVDDLWKRQDKLAEELDWLYECRFDQLTKKVTRQLIPPHLAGKHRQGYEFIYTTCVQNIDVSLKTLWVSERSSSTCARSNPSIT